MYDMESRPLYVITEMYDGFMEILCRHVKYKVRNMWVYVDEGCMGDKERDKVNLLMRVWNSECENCRNNLLKVGVEDKSACF